MVIAKPEWFKRRKFGGWGITPKTWQGWMYISIVILPYVLFVNIGAFFPSFGITEEMIKYVTMGWIAFLLIDVFDVMIRMKQDEREEKHEAMAERNASWFMMFILVCGILYEVIISGMNNILKVNIFLLVALFGGMIVKSLSNIYYDKKD